MSVWIKDGVHGDVFVSDAAQALMDTSEMQRLRRVAQTSFCSLIYPSANHTRFEHSLGTYYLANRWCLFHNVDKDKGSALALHALLHDVGHPAMSHALEPILKEHTGKDHDEWREEKLKSGVLKDVLDEHGASENIYTEVIEGELGVDRMDYLLRDSKYTGVAYGAVDADRILRKTKYFQGKLVLEDNGLSAAEAMLLARFMMFPSIYNHAVPKAAEFMVQRAVEKAIEDNEMRADELVELDDYQLTDKLRGNALMQRLLRRDLFKTAFSKPLKSFENWLDLGGWSGEQKKKVEQEIADLAETEVIFYVPKPWFGDIKIKVLRDDDFWSIGEVSLISRVLKEAQWDYCSVKVLCAKEHKEKVSDAAKKVLGV